MTISAKIVADSISQQNIRIATLQLRYPKFIHGEFMTHRVFSRNASSSRAIPVWRMIKDVMDDPAMPVSWGRNRPGMQAAEELEGNARQEAIDAWLFARDDAVKHVNHLVALGTHKQIVNRLIEPWAHINVVVTATEWANFFALRLHPDAQPEMRALAEAVWIAMQQSTPNPLCPGDWHLPYVQHDDWRNWPQDLIVGGDGYTWPECLDNLIRLSVARCARVSYLTQDGRKPSVTEDLALYDRLVGSVPLHASPAEHQATPDGTIEGVAVTCGGWQQPELHGNFVGWVQYRKTLPYESATDR